MDDIYCITFRKLEKQFAIKLFALSLAVAVVFLYFRFSLQPENSIIFEASPRVITDSFAGWLILEHRIWTFQFLSLLNPSFLCGCSCSSAERVGVLGVPRLVVCVWG